MKVISEKQAEELTSLSRPTLYRLRRRGDFPAMHQLTPQGRKGYLEHEVLQWIEEKTAKVTK